MNILILEDEPQAAQRVRRMLTELLPDATVVASIDSVKKAVRWFSENQPPDLALMDIQLADGLSFEIFEQCHVTCPIVFTTAYDEYALKAFKVNSIDYILKPFDKEELSAALSKLRNFKHPDGDVDLLANISKAVKMLTKKHKSRFVIKVGEHLKTIETETVRYFFIEEKVTFCATDENRKYILDYTLDQLEELVDPDRYFRVNRKYLVSAKAIDDIIQYTNSRLRLVLKGSQDGDVIVARERVQEFRNWLDQ